MACEDREVKNEERDVVWGDFCLICLRCNVCPF